MRTDATLWQFGGAGLWEAKKHQEAHRLGNRILGTGEAAAGVVGGATPHAFAEWDRPTLS
jgi:hypothetical protein